MKNIKEAIELEKQYIQFRLEGKEPFSFANEIKKLGFANLNDYYNAKLDYQISELEFSVEETSPLEAAALIMSYMRQKKNGILLMDTHEVIAYCGSKDFNREYCIENNIPIIDYYSNGGTMIASENEFNIGLVMPPLEGLTSNYILQKIKNILDEYYDEGEVVVDNNDILINGKKVCGATVYPTSEIFGFTAQFSFDDKSELISKICYPSESGSNKEPGFIDKLTRKELREKILLWLTNEEA